VKLILRTSRHVVPAAIVFSATLARAVEPSKAQAADAVVEESKQPVRPAALTGAPASPAATDVNAANSEAMPNAEPQAQAASPNSVEASPYGSAADTAQAVAAPVVAAPAEKDVPATLFDSDYAIGGFGGLGASYTRFAGRDRPIGCFEAGVIIDHAFTLGGGGCMILMQMNGESYGTGEPNPGDRLHFGYGGAIARYHFLSRRAVNFAVGALVGAGAVEVRTWNGQGDETNLSENYTTKSSPDAILVVEPQISVYANLRRWLRICAIGGYRFASGIDTKGLSATDVMGPTLGGQIQGGWF
jgi:hypothetical protein